MLCNRDCLHSCVSWWCFRWRRCRDCQTVPSIRRYLGKNRCRPSPGGDVWTGFRKRLRLSPRASAHCSQTSMPSTRATGKSDSECFYISTKTSSHPSKRGSTVWIFFICSAASWQRSRLSCCWSDGLWWRSPSLSSPGTSGRTTSCRPLWGLSSACRAAPGPPLKSSTLWACARTKTPSGCCCTDCEMAKTWWVSPPVGLDWKQDKYAICVDVAEIELMCEL